MQFAILASLVALSLAAPSHLEEPGNFLAHGEPVDSLAHGEPEDSLAHGEPEDSLAHGESEDSLAHGEPNKDFVAIMRDERVQEPDGRFNVEFEAANGIKVAQAGSPDTETGAVMQAGEYTYTAPDGTIITMKFVANENGFQPESDMLPVAPEFPHEIPQFVLDQIAFAEEEDARKAKELASQPQSLETEV